MFKWAAASAALCGLSAGGLRDGIVSLQFLKNNPWRIMLIPWIGQFYSTGWLLEPRVSALGSFILFYMKGIFDKAQLTFFTSSIFISSRILFGVLEIPREYLLPHLWKLQGRFISRRRLPTLVFSFLQRFKSQQDKSISGHGSSSTMHS